MNPLSVNQLGELVTFVGGGTPRRDRPDYWGGQIPWASVKDLQDHNLHNTAETITEQGLKNSASNVIPENTVIIASRVGLGKASIARIPVAINQDLKALIPRSKNILPHYLLFFLMSRAEELRRAGAGATVQGITISYLDKIPIHLPPLAEQRRIVDLLNEADQLRELRTQADSRTADLIPALFHEMFGDPAENPNQWPTKSLREISAKISDGPFGSYLKSSHYEPLGIRVVRLQNIGVGQFLDDDRAFISNAHFRSLKNHECLPGDVLVGTLGNPNLRACILPSYIDQALNKADCVQIRPRKDVANSEFVCAILNLPETLALASGRILGQTRSRISMGRLADLPVPVPPLSLQNEFSDRVREVRSIESEQAASREKLEALFLSLLHRAFNANI